VCVFPCVCVCVSERLLSVSQHVCVSVHLCTYVHIIYTNVYMYILSELNFLLCTMYTCMCMHINQCNCNCRWQHFRFARTKHTQREKIENCFRRLFICTFTVRFGSVHLAPNSKFRRALISFYFLSNFLLYARAHTH